MSIKILQYTIQSLKNNKNNLEFFLNNVTCDIAILSKVFSHDFSYRNIVNFGRIEKHRGDGYGRVAIAHKNSIVIASASNKGTNMLLTSVYFEVNNLIKKLDPFNKVIISGDFNARFSDFGDSINNRKGVFLKRVTSIAVYRLENNISPTFKRTIDSVSGSVLDLRFTKGIHCTEWTCKSLYIGGSHHFPIVYKINADLSLPIQFLSKNRLFNVLGKIESCGSISNLT